MKNNKFSESNSNKNTGRRVARVEKEIQSVISTFIIQKMQSELPGLVTVSRVQVPADLRLARVFISLMSLKQDQNLNDSDLKTAVKTLQNWAVDIQDEIGSKLNMKYLPKLTFFPDQTTEKILKVERIISTLNSDNTLSDDDLDESDDSFE